jgi:hypothetical protein
MPSLKDNFDELMERVRTGRELGHASFEPIYYLIFHPKEILDVKRSLPAWIAKLRNDGWEAEQFSIAQEVRSILDHAPMMKIWLAEDKKAPLLWDKTNLSLANAITNGSLKGRLEAKL